ncbi:MAG: SLBB domain-containing protein [Alphaproteobacteria bacterium]|nr:SLBB domain-containing protein [Alphaproteobacteria bacterium]
MSISSTGLVAHAQQGNLNPESLGALIQGLQGLREDGLFPGIGNSGDILDSVRDRTLRQASEAEEGLSSNTVVLSDFETIVANRFCTGELDDQDLPLLETVNNFSRLERDTCLRAGELLLQVGYEIFQGKFSPEILLNGAAPGDLKLGIGDELVITLVGQQSQTQTVNVDREGRVALSQLPPIPASGLTLSEFKRELSARASAAFIGTEAFVSLGAVRQISVLVVGEVPKPGPQQVTALSSVLDAIGLAGGIKKTGSLRKIEIRRGEDIYWIDLYDLVLGQGGTRDLTLAEGDRIVIPTIGRVVAISGDVKRPGIFELAEGQREANFEELMLFSGGTLRPRGVSFTRIGFDDSGIERIDEVLPENLVGTDGDLIVAGRSADKQIGGVELAGHVRVPGIRSIRSASTIRTLLGDKDALRGDPYLLLGVLETSDPSTNARRRFPLSLLRVLEGSEDYQLRDGDRLLVLSKQDIAYLSSNEVQRIIANHSLDSDGIQVSVPGRASDEADYSGQSTTISSLQRIAANVAGNNSSALGRDSGPGDTRATEASPGTSTIPGRCESLRELDKLVSETRSGRFSNAVVASEGADRLRRDRPDRCNETYEGNLGLLPFVLEHGAAVSGEVRAPGIYPLVAGTSLASLVGVVGGLTREADISRIELSRFQTDDSTGGSSVGSREEVDTRARSLDSVSIGPGDVVRFNPVFTDRDAGPVFLVGEFIRPGSYEIRRGERLSELVARAGGLTAQAYAFGAIFTRERVRRAEQASLQRLARELNSAVTVAAANRGIDAGAITSFAALTRDISQAPASGRVVMEADPTVLQVRPELDIVLEPGDRLFMPKRPNSVLVTGDVLNPGAMQFVSGKSIDTYIRQAGGFQQSADRNRLFVVLPNGAAQPVSVSAFNYTPIRVPPGSAIVVPKDATPFDVFTITREIASVLSQLAITAASLAVISNN